MVNTIKTSFMGYLYEHKIESIALAFGSSAVIDTFFVEYDWGYCVIGVVGFLAAWAFSHLDNKDKEQTDKYYWGAKLLLAIIIPLFFTNTLVSLVGLSNIKFDGIEVLSAFMLGVLPEYFLKTSITKVKSTVKKILNKDESNSN